MYDRPILSLLGIVITIIHYIIDYDLLFLIYGLIILLYIIILNTIRYFLKKP